MRYIEDWDQGDFFIEGDDDYRCNDCSDPINLERYRRKVPRCDNCEAISILDDLNGVVYLPKHWEPQVEWKPSPSPTSSKSQPSAPEPLTLRSLLRKITRT